MERRFIPAPACNVRLLKRAGDDGPSIIQGYGSVFYDGTPETEFELWHDVFERIMPGTFDRAIAEDDVRGLFNHDPDHVLGRNTASTMLLVVDKKGLRYEIDAPDTQLGHDLGVSIGREDVTGSSFSFNVTDEEWRTENGKEIREISGVRLFDVGPVTFPAYEGATAAVRSDGDVAEARAAYEARGAERKKCIDHALVRTRMREIEMELDAR